MRIDYSTDIDTIFGQYADVECVLSVSQDGEDTWSVDGLYLRRWTGGGEALLSVNPHGPSLHNKLAGAIIDNAERDIRDPESKLRRAIDEAVNYGEAA